MSLPAPVLPRRVVVTGLSVACALGFEVSEFWRNILEGRVGVVRLPFVPEDSPLPCEIGGHIPEETLRAALGRYDITDPDRSNQLALYAAGRALESAGLKGELESPLPYDVILGTGHGNTIFHNESMRAYLEGGYRKIRPTAVIRLMFNRPANVVSIHYHLTGVSFTVSAACATGSIALGTAFQHVRFGLADGALAVCADTGLDLPTFSAWNRLGILSRNPDPEKACRPFDRDRDGLVMGEGAAGFVLESLETAQARGATIWAEVAGIGTSSDARHIVQPDAQGQVKALRRALENSGVAPEEVDYVNAHGTATKLADAVECASLLEALGEAGRRVPVSNTKAQLGHLMGATAGVEMAVTILALQHQRIPPCRNLDHPDADCPLNFVRDRPLDGPVRIALKNSFAFGGTNSVVVLRRFEE
jgi:3-oxoacyl-(acyl-carrier-protein) synthase